MLKTKLGDLELDGVFTNGSGANDDSLDKLLQIADSRAGFVTTKTTTFLPRPGNPGPRFYILGNVTINAMGLPNPGYTEMARIIGEVKKRSKKPVFASMAGFNLEETEAITKALSPVADVLEVNLSCPNIKGKSQTIYDLQATEDVLRTVKNHTNKKIAVKAGPFLDGGMQLAFCELAKKIGVSYIVAVNSLGNALYIDPDRKRIMLRPKWGGMGGEAIRMIGWGNVRRYYEYFQGSIPIIGCGGIMNGKDAFSYALLGASAFASASGLYKEGPAIFERMERELEAELTKHGFANLQEAVGNAEEF